MDTNPGYALAAVILRELEPKELPALPGVWTAYERRPARPEELHSRDDPVGSGVGDRVIAWAPLVVAFLCSEVLRAGDEAEDAHRSGFRRLPGPIRGRAPQPKLTQPLEFGDEDLRRIHAKAVETALELGEVPVRAALFADAVVGGLSRLAQPPRDD